VPFIALALVYVRRESLPPIDRRWLAPAILFGSLGAGAVAAAVYGRSHLSLNDSLTLTTLAYVCFLLAGGFLFAGKAPMIAAAFPAAFMLFLVPPPDALAHTIESLSVLGSAEMSEWLFHLTGTPLVKEGTVFVLPGITLEIARECSGINSSWSLFIVSMVTSNLFLKATWSRVALVAFVAPLAVFRNSMRILTVGMLCVHVGPHMIDSYIHRSGGPIFFALSLIPLFLAALWLRHVER
jgi:exosortase